MADEHATEGESLSYRCPWCSAALPATDLETCPSCGAALTSTAEATLPGVTAIDHEAILRATREPIRPNRSRFLSWLSGEYVEETATPAAPEAISPPDAAVKAEILRLEIQAEIADRQAEATSILADAAVEGRPLPGFEPEPPAEAADEADQPGATEIAEAEPGLTNGAAAAEAAPASEDESAGPRA